jgi:putative ABC transport system substrate-binding protein
MRKNVICLTLCALLFALCSSASAQQPGKVPRIGYLTPSTSPNRSYIEAFRQGLRDLGYVEGKNLVIEWRANEGKLDRNPTLAAELVRLKVDVIVAVGSAEIRAAKEATAEIPIVMVRGGDPVGSGHVASLAQPGGTLLDWHSFAPS